MVWNCWHHFLLKHICIYQETSRCVAVKLDLMVSLRLKPRQ